MVGIRRTSRLVPVDRPTFRMKFSLGPSFQNVLLFLHQFPALLGRRESQTISPPGFTRSPLESDRAPKWIPLFRPS
jgi:hypothetical protein